MKIRLQFRSIPRTSVSKCLTPPTRGGGRCAPHQPMSFLLASAVRKWALLGEMFSFFLFFFLLSWCLTPFRGTEVCACVFQCGELLSRFSAGGQRRRWRVLLRQTGRAQLWQKNQRLLVPVVSSTHLSSPVPQQPLASLCPFPSPLSSADTQTHQHYPSLTVRLLLLNCVCLCFSDCESQEVLTLLCQGKTFTEIRYHCPAHLWTHSHLISHAELVFLL